jgi:hypothetical protein
MHRWVHRTCFPFEEASKFWHAWWYHDAWILSYHTASSFQVLSTWNTRYVELMMIAMSAQGNLVFAGKHQVTTWTFHSQAKHTPCVNMFLVERVKVFEMTARKWYNCYPLWWLHLDLELMTTVSWTLY